MVLFEMGLFFGVFDRDFVTCDENVKNVIPNAKERHQPSSRWPFFCDVTVESKPVFEI